MGIALRGRDFTEQEDKPEHRVAIVNETFAKKFFPGQNAIGKRFNFSSASWAKHNDPNGRMLDVAWRVGHHFDYSDLDVLFLKLWTIPQRLISMNPLSIAK